MSWSGSASRRPRRGATCGFSNGKAWPSPATAGRPIRVHLTGGRLRGASYELVGSAAAQTLQGLNVDVAFIGVNGISVERGLTTFNEEGAEIKRAMGYAAP